MFVGALLGCHLPPWDQDSVAVAGGCCCLCFWALGTPDRFKGLLGMAIVTFKVFCK